MLLVFLELSLASVRFVDLIITFN